MSNTNNANRYAQVDETLWDHPKTTNVVKSLRCDRAKIHGHLPKLWNWAIKNRPDGDLSDVSFRDISDAARYTNPDDFSEEADAKADAFVNALINARTHAEGYGFLEQDGKGIYIHDWHLYGGRLNEKRLRNAFAQWILRLSKGGITVPNNETTFNEWLDDREALKERYKNGNSGGSIGNGTGGKTKPIPPAPAATTTTKRGQEKNDDSNISSSDGDGTVIDRHNDGTSSSHDDVSASSLRHTGTSLTSPPNRAERSRAEQSRTERSVEEQQHSRTDTGDDGFAETDLPPVDDPPVVAVSSPSEKVFATAGNAQHSPIPASSAASSRSADANLVFRLVAAGMNRPLAEELAVKFPEECERQLVFVVHVKEFKASRGAYLANAIREKWGPPKGHVEQTAGRENIPRIPVGPPKPMPTDWIPGADDSEVRSLANQAFHRVKITHGDGLRPLSIAVRDEARVIWQGLNPDVAPPWEKQSPAVDETITGTRSTGSGSIPSLPLPGEQSDRPDQTLPEPGSIRSVIAESLEADQDAIAATTNPNSKKKVSP